MRLLQSSIRLSQGHARLLHRSEVTTQDAVMAVVILEACNDSWSSLIQGCNIITSDFPPDPLEEYRVQARAVLTGLDLHHLWEEEKVRLEQLLSWEQVPSSRTERSGSSFQARQATDLTQVVREIQRNRAATLPPPDCRTKRKRKQKKTIRDSRPTQVNGVEDSEDEDDFSPVHQSTQRDPPSQGDSRPVLKESSLGGGDTTLTEDTGGNKSLSNKTLAKLNKFRRIEKETENENVETAVDKENIEKVIDKKNIETVTDKKNTETVIDKENIGSETVKEKEKSNLAQLLFAAKNLENKREEKMNAETEVKEFPWEDNDDFQDFDFDD